MGVQAQHSTADHHHHHSYDHDTHHHPHAHVLTLRQSISLSMRTLLLVACGLFWSGDYAAAVPAGMVTFFDTTACPTGWTAIASVQGRLILSTISTDAGSTGGGSALGNMENRAHTHSYSGSVSVNAKNIVASGGSNNDGAHSGTYNVGGTSGSSTSGLPFSQLLACQLNADIGTMQTPANTIAYFSSSTCPSSWTTFGPANGRFMIPRYASDYAGVVSSVSSSNPSGTINHQHSFAINVDMQNTQKYWLAAGGSNSDPAAKGTYTIYGTLDNQAQNIPYVKLLTCTTTATVPQTNFPTGTLLWSSSKCTAGWSTYTSGSMMGRFLVGLPNGGTFRGSFGASSLTADQTSSVGSHTHSFGGSIQTSGSGITGASDGPSPEWLENGSYGWSGTCYSSNIDLPYIHVPLCIQTTIFGTITPSSTSLATTIGATVSFTLTLSIAAPALIQITAVVPSSCTIIGGGLLMIPQGASSLTVTIQAGNAAAVTQSITFGYAVSGSLVYNNVAVSSSVGITIYGTMSVIPSVIKVGYWTDATATFTITINPTPSSAVTVVVTPPSTVTIIGGNTIIIATGQSSKIVTVLTNGRVAGGGGTNVTFATASSLDTRYNGAMVMPQVKVWVGEMCSYMNGNCDTATVCTDGFQNTTCSACPSGYEGTGKTGCRDIDECARGYCAGWCLNTIGSYYCAPKIIPRTLSVISGAQVVGGKIVLQNTNGGQGLTYMITNTNIPITSITYSNGMITLACASYSTQMINSTHSMIACTTAAGVGTNYAFTMQVCVNTTLCITSSMTDVTDVFGYPPPLLTPTTLRFYGGTPSDHILVTDLTATVSFDGVNLINDSSLISVTYGPPANPNQFVCTIDPLRTNDATITCNTDPSAYGINMKFTVKLAGVSLLGTDIIEYLIQPRVFSIVGCTQNGFKAVDCPTRGNINITLIGHDLLSPITVYIGSMPCIVQSLVGTTNVTCLLQAGKGFDIAVFVQCGQQASPSAILLSYARPTITSITGCSPSDDGNPIHIVQCARLGGSWITINGADFGEAGALVLIGGDQCLNVIHTIPYTQIQCQLPPGNQADRPVVIFQRGGELSQSDGQLSYLQCEAGWWQSSPTECTPAPPGYYTTTINALVLLPCLPGYYSLGGTDHCTICDAGTYAGAASASCTNCTSGFYSPTTGRSECLMAPAGYYSEYATGSTTCIPCDTGYWQAHSGRASCDPCQKGSVSSTPGSVTCVTCNGGTMANDEIAASLCIACDMGTFSLDGSTVCVSCTPGHFNPSVGQSQCSSCSQGTYSTSVGASICDPCPKGSSQALTGQSYCDLCAPGAYTAIDGLAHCVSCDIGRYSPYNSSSCMDCSMGTSQALPGSSYCDACTPGTYTEKDGRAQCIACDSGKISADYRATTCSSCGIGSYQPYSGTSFCIACDIGSSNNGIGKAECSNCDVGKYAANTSSLVCIDCPTGTAQAITGQSSCIACGIGHFASIEGRAECLACPTGTYTNINGTIDCTPCPMGYYSDISSGATSCTKCIAGTIASQPGALYCVMSTPGNYVPEAGSANVTACALGYVTKYYGATVCDICGVGTFTPSTGQSECTPCDSGYYQSSNGSSSCTKCPVGYFQSEKGSAECHACAAGVIAASPGSVECVKCPTSSYAPVTASSECIDCPTRSVSGDGKKCECEIGYYATSSGMASMQCAVCTTGMMCNRAGVSLETIETQPGYWRADNTSTTFIRCLRVDHCSGGALAGEGTCGAHRIGPLCNICEDGYRSTRGGTCEECPSQSNSIGISIVLSILLIIGLAILYYTVIVSSETARRKERALARARTSLALAVGTNDHDAAELAEDAAFLGMHIQSKVVVLTPESRVPRSMTYNLKIILGFGQIINSLSLLIDVPYPSYFAEFVRNIAIINFSFIPWQSVQCIAPFTYYTKMLITALAPIIVLATGALVLGAPLWILEKRDFSDDNRRRDCRKRWRKMLTKATLFTLFLVFPAVSSVVLGMFVCRTVNGTNYLVADFTLICGDSEWQSYLPAAIIFVLLYPVGIPILLLYLLKRYRRIPEPIASVRGASAVASGSVSRAIDDATAAASSGRSSFTDAASAEHAAIASARLSVMAAAAAAVDKSEDDVLAFLYLAYGTGEWWFELVDMTHKLFLTSILVFFPYGAQLPAGLVVCGLYTIVVLLKQPYVRARDDKLQLLVQVEIMLLLLSGHVLDEVSELEPGSAMDVVLSVLLICLSCVCILMFIFHIFTYLRTQWRTMQRERQKNAALTSSFHHLNTNDDSNPGGGDGDANSMELMSPPSYPASPSSSSSVPMSPSMASSSSPASPPDTPLSPTSTTSLFTPYVAAPSHGHGHVETSDIEGV